LALIAKSATGALAVFHRLHSAVADAAPAPAGERWDHRDGTAPGEGNASDRDAELMKRDAEIVRRLRKRLAEAFDAPTNHPFFRRDWLPGEDADAALLRIFRSNKQVLARSDDDIINTIVEHAIKHWRV